ncbi:MAG: DinB family protein [Myxococcaceae bacterium]|nr:DinB family protein [Myxococcaceae bacterium]
MLDRDYVRLMCEYNGWMNDKVYTLCATFPDAERKLDRGAFFKSIHGTLSHLLWADRANLTRLLSWDLPFGKPSDILFDEFDALWLERKRLDTVLLEWAEGLTEGALATTIEMRSVTYQRRRRMPLQLLVVQMFNHQTHHRGQLTTLLSQLGHDVGSTDLPFMPFADTFCEDLPF